MGRLVVYGRLIKFSHTVFALPFALTALFLAARGWPGWVRLGLILCCMVTARAAAMTFNRIADVRIDARNPRTVDRPLQTGRITLRGAWVFYGLCCVAFVAACWLFWPVLGNYWPVVCSVPVLGFVSLYSLAKRITSLCHLMLGAALGLGPMGAWLAVAPETFGLPAIVLGAAVVCWVAGFDIIYGLQDIPVDRREGLWSLPVRLGPAGALWVSRALHVAAAGLLMWLGPLVGLGWPYRAGAIAAIVALIVQHSLVSARDYRRAGAVFFYANAVTSCVLAAGAIADVLLRA